MSWTNKIGRIHMVNSSGTPVPGGSPFAASTTPFAILQGWTLTTAEPPEDGATDYREYSTVEETIPFAVVGTSTDNVAQRLQDLKRELMRASPRSPVAWQLKPYGATNDGYTEIYHGRVSERVTEGLSPIEGFYDLEGTLALTHHPFLGASSLDIRLSAVSFGNIGTGTPNNMQYLGAMFDGDLVNSDGQPLNITIAKPASQAANTLYLATAQSRAPVTINNAKTASGTTIQTFTTSSAIDLSALRTNAALKLRVLARVKTLTNPTKAQVRVTVAASGGSTLWVSPWVTCGANTTAQLLDLQGIGLDMLRYPLANTSNVTIQGALRSSDGSSVTATLDYLEALLYYDFCVVDNGGLASGQQYRLLGAQNLSGGGWLPLASDQAKVVTTADASIKDAIFRQTLVRAFADASLYLAWTESDGGHTATDTTTVTCQMAPLWRSLRGVT